MVQTTLHRYFVPDPPREASSPGVTFLHLPFSVRRRVYAYAGLPGGLDVTLNYWPPEGVCPQTLRGFRPGLNHVPSEDDCPEIYLEYPEAYFDSRVHRSGLLEKPWASLRDESLLYFLIGLFPYPAPRVARICRYCLYVEEEQWCSCDPLPYQLLFVSLAVRKELLSVFYSESKFSVLRSELGGLSGLLSFPPDAISQMTSLSIHANVLNRNPDSNRGLNLNSSKDHYSHDCNSCLAPRHEELLSKGASSGDQIAVTEWAKLWDYIGTSILPNRLKLCIACNTEDLEVAKEFLGPLFQLPKLKECAIRLGGPSNIPLEQLAAKTAYTLVSHRNTLIESPFKFMDLPDEIQLQILRYTDLVSHHDIIWLPPRGNLAMGRRLLNYRLKYSYHASLGDVHFDCCGQCSDALNACYCWTRYAAGSTSCSCWKFPTSILLTCKKLRDHAVYIFFSLNHFVLRHPSPYGEAPLGIREFLTEIPKDGRQYLRSITILVSLGNPNFPFTRDFTSHKEWLQTMNLLVHEVNISQLTITIDSSGTKNFVMANPDYHLSTVELLARESQERVAAGFMVESLQGHNWKNVFFHLSWPYVWPFSPVHGYDLGKKTPLHKCLYKKEEGKLEKGIMGDAYDSNSRGKLIRRHKWNGYYCTECKDCDTPWWVVLT